jgi:hypothetical protein
MRAVNRQPWFPREGHVDTVIMPTPQHDLNTKNGAIKFRNYEPRMAAQKPPNEPTYPKIHHPDLQPRHVVLLMRAECIWCQSVRNPILAWAMKIPKNMTHVWQPKSVKIGQNLTPGDVTQAFKSCIWVLIMIPGNTRTKTGLKTEIRKFKKKMSIFDSSWPTLPPLNLFRKRFPEHGVSGKSNLDTFYRAGRRGFPI